MAVSFVYLLVSLLIFLLPLAIGILMIVRSRPKTFGHPACGRCAYDLTATIGASTRCPECGADFAAVGITPPTAKRNRAMLWGGMALILIPVIFLIIPTIGLVFMLPAASQARMRAAQARAALVQQQAVLAQTQAAQAQQPTVPLLTPEQVGTMSEQDRLRIWQETDQQLQADDLDEPTRVNLRHNLKLLEVHLNRSVEELRAQPPTAAP